MIGAGAHRARRRRALLAARGARVRVARARAPSARARSPSWPAGVELRVGDDDAERARRRRPGRAEPRRAARRTRCSQRGRGARHAGVERDRARGAPARAARSSRSPAPTARARPRRCSARCCAADGQRVFVGGNLGTPLADAVVDAASAGTPRSPRCRASSSSGCRRFRPRVGGAAQPDAGPSGPLRRSRPTTARPRRDLLAPPGERRRRRCSTATTPGCGSSAAARARTVLSFGRDPVEFGTYRRRRRRRSSGAPASRSASRFAREPAARRAQPREPAGGDHRRARPGACRADAIRAGMRADRRRCRTASSWCASATACAGTTTPRRPTSARSRSRSTAFPAASCCCSAATTRAATSPCCARACAARVRARHLLRQGRRRRSPRSSAPAPAPRVVRRPRRRRAPRRRAGAARAGRAARAGLRQLRRVPRLRTSAASASAPWWRPCEPRCVRLSRLQERVVMPRLTRPRRLAARRRRRPARLRHRHGAQRQLLPRRGALRRSVPLLPQAPGLGRRRRRRSAARVAHAPRAARALGERRCCRSACWRCCWC